MGNWRYRYRRRFYDRQYPPSSPPRPIELEPSPPRSWQDGVASWEKKFCAKVGSIPWQKVVRAKNFMYCHGNVLNWDDSAGEEAFQNAKKRFWAEINGLQSNTSIPDPDIYIDEIDWNPNIDPALMEDLDKAFFAPDEGEKNDEVWGRNKRSRELASVPSEGCNGNTNNVDNPWECNYVQASESLKDKTQGWSQWDKTINESRNWDNENNPWCSQGHGTALHYAWKDVGDKSGWCNQGGNHVISWSNGKNAQESNCQGWGNSRNSRRGWNQRESANLNNGENPWQKSFIHDNGALKDRGWKDDGGSSWGWKQRDNKDFNPQRNNGGWGMRNEGFRKRESSHQNMSGYKRSRIQGNGCQTGSCWSNGRIMKRVNFVFE